MYSTTVHNTLGTANSHTQTEHTHILAHPNPAPDPDLPG